ncbi:NAD(P)H-dependent oxidoreductase [Streptomyces sp. NPDC052020]|uniref:flavodoxin family protein n=1 Tax=Streptomyces sp. NPDC052020 TaxID=3155677 RepID=UPI0034310139
MTTRADTRSFLFVLASHRAGGRTEELARKWAADLPSATAQRWLRLADLALPDFCDHRGDGTGTAPGENESLLLEATLEVSDLVIVSPLYWYSVTASAKLYLDYWGRWMELDGVGFRERMRGKRLWAVCTLSEGKDIDDTRPMLDMLSKSAAYLGMEWSGALVGDHHLR